MRYPTLEGIKGAHRASSLMTEVLEILSGMSEAEAFTLEKTGKVTISLNCEKMAETMNKLTGQRITEMENGLDGLGDEYGFGVDVLVSDAEFKLQVVALAKDDDQPPIDDDDIAPVIEIDNVDVVETIAQPKTMVAHG